MAYMPTDPSNQTPPPVNGTGSVGVSTSFARADHTHVSSVKRKRMTTPAPSGGSTTVTWTFATPYDVGVVPVVVATAQNISGGPPLVVNLVGDPTNTSVTFTVFRSQATLASLLTSLFSPAASGLVINAIAALNTE